MAKEHRRRRGKAKPWNVKAYEEFRRYPELNREDLESLRSWISSVKHMPQNVDDEMLLHFLHASYYNIERTKSTVECFYTYRATMNEFFDNWDPLTKETQDIINNILIAAPLPTTDEEGNKVIVCKLKDTKAANFNYPICIKWFLITATVAQWNLGIQPGYIVVYDSAGFTMSHLFKCSLSSMRNYINWGENASPMRVLKLVFINTSPVVKKLISIVKPFLSKELLNMFEFHTDSESYFKTMESNNVPEDYGGSAPPLLTLHNENTKHVIDHRRHLMYEVTMKKIEDVKGAGKPKNDVIKEVDTSFNNLEID